MKPCQHLIASQLFPKLFIYCIPQSQSVCISECKRLEKKCNMHLSALSSPNLLLALWLMFWSLINTTYKNWYKPQEMAQGRQVGQVGFSCILQFLSTVRSQKHHDLCHRSVRVLTGCYNLYYNSFKINNINKVKTFKLYHFDCRVTVPR